jgi:branched-chain amino acid transport system ATP-binding protein
MTVTDSTASLTPPLRTDLLTGGYLPGTPILRGCSIVAGAGEIVGVIGPNGAGKSTLLKAVVGQLPRLSGDVLLNGLSIVKLAPHDRISRGLGFVPQRDNVFRTMSVLDNLRVGRHLRPKRCAARLGEVTGVLPQLERLLPVTAGSLSGGERQLVAMARALTPDPSVLLLDEPSAGLAPNLRSALFALCQRISEGGVSLLIVEQNARRCLAICDRAYVLDQGSSARTGAGPDLLRDPEVAALYLGGHR